MTVASRAVMMAVMTEVRMIDMIDVEQTPSPANIIGQNEYVFPCVHILAVATVLHLHVNILEVLELMLHAE